MQWWRVWFYILAAGGLAGPKKRLPMSSDQVIQLAGVSKCYQSYQRPADRLVQSLFRMRRKLYQEFWALSDISLEVCQAETLGVIGSNGSGKSTLLQVISGILTPTAGTVKVNGRISALLELGAGFNPEFTGLENAKFNAAILGLSQKEVAHRMQDIKDFANLGDFFDKPIKTYSSGMAVRLGFAVAIHMDPDILIVDEALAVGDVRFQRKCFRKINELKERGVSILFVTHSMEVITNLCDRAIWLDKGKIRYTGPPNTAVNLYLEEQMGEEIKADIAALNKAKICGQVDEKPKTKSPTKDFCRQRSLYNQAEFRWGNGEAKIVDFVCTDEQKNEIVTTFPTGQTVHIYMVVFFSQDLDELVFGLTIKHLSGVTLFGSNSIILERTVRSAIKGEVRIVHFSFHNNLLPNDYFISLGVATGTKAKGYTAVDRRYDLIHLKITEPRKALGYVDFGAKFSEWIVAEKTDHTQLKPLSVERIRR